MASKQIGIKEKEQNRKNPVLGMISSEVAGMAAETTVDDQIHLKNDSQSDSESETIESLKKQLEEAKAALKVQSTKKTRIKDTRVNLLMYKDVYNALKSKCKKETFPGKAGETHMHANGFAALKTRRNYYGNVRTAQYHGNEL